MKIREVFVFVNGNVAAIGDDGQQIPELQGRFSDVVARLLPLCDDQTLFWGWPDIRWGGRREDRR